MKPRIHVLSLTIALFGFFISFGQTDKSEIEKLFAAAEQHLMSNPDSFDIISDELEVVLLEANDSTNLMKLTLYKGIKSAMQNDLDIALVHFQKVWRYAYQVNDKGLLISALNNTAGIYRYNGNYQKAEEYMLKAMEVEDPKESPVEVAHLMVSLAMVVDVQDRLDEAEALLKEALEIFKQAEAHEMIMKTMTELGFILEKNEEYRQAVGLYESIIPLYERAGMSSSLASVQQRLGGVYLKLGAYNKSYTHLKESLNLSDSMGYQVQLDTTYIWLIKAASRLGKLSEVDVYLNQLSAYHKKQIDKNLEEALNELETAHLIESKQLENDILKTESENQKLELANIRNTLIGTISFSAILIVLMIVVYQYNQKVKTYSQKLAAANEELEMHVKAKTELLDSRNMQLIQASFALAHEIRAKVSTIMGAAELLGSDVLSDDDYDELLSAVKHSSKELDIVVRDLISRLED